MKGGYMFHMHVLFQYMYMLHVVEAKCYWENDSGSHLLRAWHKRIGGQFLCKEKDNIVKYSWELQGKAEMSTEGSAFFKYKQLHS